MRKGKVILAAAVTGLGLASGAMANPIVDMGLVVRSLDTTSGNAGTIIAPTSTVGTVKHYSMSAGQLFRVELAGTVRSGTNYVTETDHDDPTALPLGIQVLNANLLATGTVAPVSATGANAGRWGRDAAAATLASKITPVSSNSTVASFQPISGTSVTGAGYAQNQIPAWDGSQTVQTLQLGLTGTPAGNDAGSTIGTFLRGGYVAGANGGTISTQVTDLNVYWDDPADSDANALKSIALGNPQSGSFVNASIAIDVAAIPEPASASLLGVAALGLLARRRRA